jgi:hypothetical protein
MNIKHVYIKGLQEADKERICGKRKTIQGKEH